ncbi:Rho termination factor N-terminal domain-containing protein [Amycolatopsis sp. NBC_00438]|uniref:Rho termination factor N-terminal domain-containing protein n=1 Tax=Amycolatopsis sp. NBC_00438 TaxID=2903558 RepID=UPI002E1DEACD
MSELKSFAVLQARIYEFLAQQDETTLQAIVSGEAQLTVLRPGTAPAAAPVAAPSDDRSRKLSDLTVPKLKEMAEQLGLTRYKSLKKAALVALLAGQDQPEATAPEPIAEEAAKPATAPDPPPAPAEPSADVAAITARLSEIETEADGAAYLKAQHLDRETLLAVAAELQLTRVERLTHTELQKKVLRQAIGARRRFAGLRKW